MPELPEVETVRRGLQPSMKGRIIKAVELGRPDLRFPFPPDFAERIAGTRIKELARRAKFLLAHLDSGECLIMHLGMSGSFRIEGNDGHSAPGAFHYERSARRAHDHVIFHIEENGTETRVIYNDPRRFGFMDLVPSKQVQDHPFFAKMGIEPLGNALSGELLAKLLAGKATPIKAALLDQRVIAGLGNIYVCEALHLAGISPRRRAGSLVRANGRPGSRLSPLAQAIRDVLNEAIASGGSSLRDHRQTDGTLGYFQHQFKVYDREGAACTREGCDGTIKRIVQSGRSSFCCPSCQR
jgi:formamidopyrimidine-DNA glycosylase